MSTPPRPHLIAADRLDGAIVVTFADGRCAVYSSDLLYAMLPQAQEVHEEKAGPEEKVVASDGQVARPLDLI